jgi:hypothetical protein
MGNSDSHAANGGSEKGKGSPPPLKSFSSIRTRYHTHAAAQGGGEEGGEREGRERGWRAVGYAPQVPMHSHAMCGVEGRIVVVAGACLESSAVIDLGMDEEKGNEWSQGMKRRNEAKKEWN